MNTDLTALPESIAAGTTVVYTRTHSDYPASDSWVLTLILQGASKLTETGSASGDSWVVTLSAAETGALTPGIYRWVERVSKAGVVYEVASGRVEVTPDFAGADAGDLQSWAEKTLAVVEAAIEGRLPAGMESYQIHGRAVSKIPMEELMKLRNRLRAEVNADRDPGAFGRQVKVSFPAVGD